MIEANPRQASDEARRKAGGNTRETLVLAAEKLFGEYGIDGVSLRQINVAAGQKNSSAAHYHFGSKDALLMAVYDYRMQRVNERRLQQLESIRRAGRQTDVRALVEAIIYPVVDETRTDAGGAHYIRFLSQAMGHPRVRRSPDWNLRHTDGMATVVDTLKSALPDLPEHLLLQRIGLLWEQIIHSLADRERLAGSKGEPSAAAELFVANLVDCAAGALTAPISAATQNAWDESKK